MYRLQDFLASLEHETKICLHLASKADPSKLDHRPSEGQRSTIELMRYLTMCAQAPADAAVNGDWSVAGQYMAAVETMTFEEFPERMQEQLDKVRSLVAEIPEEELLTRKAPLPWGVETTLGAALVDLSLKFLCAYRLQFFQHVKTTSAGDMSTYQAWMGIDPPEK